MLGCPEMTEASSHRDKGLHIVVRYQQSFQNKSLNTSTSLCKESGNRHHIGNVVVEMETKDEETGPDSSQITIDPRPKVGRTWDIKLGKPVPTYR